MTYNEFSRNLKTRIKKNLKYQIKGRSFLE